MYRERHMPPSLLVLGALLIGCIVLGRIGLITASLPADPGVHSDHTTPPRVLPATPPRGLSGQILQRLG